MSPLKTNFRSDGVIASFVGLESNAGAGEGKLLVALGKKVFPFWFSFPGFPSLVFPARVRLSGGRFACLSVMWVG